MPAEEADIAETSAPPSALLLVKATTFSLRGDRVLLLTGHSGCRTNQEVKVDLEEGLEWQLELELYSDLDRGGTQGHRG